MRRIFRKPTPIQLDSEEDNYISVVFIDVLPSKIQLTKLTQ